MDILTERAETYDQCIRKIREKFGLNFDVMRKQTVRMKGFWGFLGKEDVEISFILSRDSYRNKQPVPSARTQMDFNEEKKKILASIKPLPNPQIQEVLEEVRALKEQMSTSSFRSAGAGEDHETIRKLEQLFELNDFSLTYTKNMLERVRREFSLEQLDDYESVQNRVLEWIGESIVVPETHALSRPQVLVLVGPTGVGKTTTIAKLAASFGVSGVNGSGTLNVRMITIDNYRIAAKQQIEIYGNIMGIPVSCVESLDELKATMAYASDADVVLIDTIGRSPKDYTKIAEMREFLDASGTSADFYLTLAATTKTSDMREILRQFETFGYQSVIVTKFDETVHVGNIISALSEKNKAVSYITNGQRVPQDIEKACVVRFLTNLEGFRVNRAAVEERFPPVKSSGLL